jgi:hypothetical protein
MWYIRSVGQAFGLKCVLCQVLDCKFSYMYSSAGSKPYPKLSIDVLMRRDVIAIGPFLESCNTRIRVNLCRDWGSKVLLSCSSFFTDTELH